MSSSSDFVRCVEGDIAPDALGHAQCHEHIWLKRGKSFLVNPALCMENPAKSLSELRSYRQAGGGTLVDAQPGGFGRDLGALCRLSRESGIHIVAVSGAHKLCFLDEPGRPWGAEGARTLISELTEGVETEAGRVRTGMLKLALDAGGISDPRYEAIYAAVLAAAAETGAPLMVHTERGNDLSALLFRCAAYGISPERLLICHLDRTNTDPDVHRRLLDAGCSLCYDSIHRYRYVSDEEELALIRAMVSEGWQEQILLSLDTTNQRLRAYGAPDMGLDEILTGFRPKMRAAGISEAAIQCMCRDNARRILRFNAR